MWGIRGGRILLRERRVAGKADARGQEGASGQGHVGHIMPSPPQSLQHHEREAEEVLPGLPG